MGFIEIFRDIASMADRRNNGSAGPSGTMDLKQIAAAVTKAQTKGHGWSKCRCKYTVLKVKAVSALESMQILHFGFARQNN